MLKLREATADDAALLSRIFCASWCSAYQGLIPEDYLRRMPEDAWTPTLRSWLGSGRMYGLIALTDEEPVGAVVFGRGRDAGYEDWGEIVALYLLPEATGSGTGSALLKQALNLLREDGFARCYLWSIDGNTQAEAFYQKRGFCRTDDCIRYQLGGQDVTDVRYVLR